MTEGAETPAPRPPAEPVARPAAAADVDAAVKPTGPVAAVMIAAGIGSLVLAILTVWAAASEGFAESLAYDLEVGPLSGKTSWAVVAFFGSWAILGTLWRRRDFDLSRASLITALLVGLGLIGTFAPFFRMFEAE